MIGFILLGLLMQIVQAGERSWTFLQAPDAGCPIGWPADQPCPSLPGYAGPNCSRDPLPGFNPPPHPPGPAGCGYVALISYAWSGGTWYRCEGSQQGPDSGCTAMTASEAAALGLKH